MCFNVIHLQLCEWPILYCTRYWNELICLLCTEAFRRLNLDPHRSPSTICTIPVNGDETQVQTEAMDVCITSNEVRNTPSQHVVIRLYKHKPIFAVLFTIFFTPLPTGEREVLWWVCVYVSVCLSVVISPELHVWSSPNFLCMLPMAVAWFSSDRVVHVILYWWCGLKCLLAQIIHVVE